MNSVVILMFLMCLECVTAPNDPDCAINKGIEVSNEESRTIRKLVRVKGGKLSIPKEDQVIDYNADIVVPKVVSNENTALVEGEPLKGTARGNELETINDSTVKKVIDYNADIVVPKDADKNYCSSEYQCSKTDGYLQLVCFQAYACGILWVDGYIDGDFTDFIKQHMYGAESLARTARNSNLLDTLAANIELALKACQTA